MRNKIPREFDLRYRFPKKKYLHMKRLSTFDKEWNLWKNNRILYKGYNIPGESRTISKIKRRKYNKLLLIRKNPKRVYKYHVRRVDKII